MNNLKDQLREELLSEAYNITRGRGPEDDPDRDAPGYDITGKNKKTGKRRERYVDVSRGKDGTTTVTTYNPDRQQPGKDSGDRTHTDPRRVGKVLRAIKRMKQDPKNTVIK